MKIQVFQSERDAGLEEKILATAAVAYCVPIKSGAPVDESGRTLANFASALEIAKATNAGQPDLHYLDTILATTGWNNNDDVFDVIETWLARDTPEDKPFNLEHNCANIIGHITGCSVFDADMKPVDNSIDDFDDLPSKFHVVTGAVLYKVWSQPELQERMDTLLEEIAKGEWFVSMEALFYGFDYAMKDSSGATRVIARTEETAFLTKYLRAYGGAGKYGNYTVGRVLRNICFSGKGLVRKPANPESLILDDASIFDGRTAAQEIPEKFEEKISIPETVVYSAIAHGSGKENLESEQEMKTVEQLIAEVAERDATIASLQAAVATGTKNLETSQASLTGAAALTSKLQSDLAEVTKAKSEFEAQTCSLKSELETSVASLKAVSEELGSMKAAVKRTERLATVASKLKTKAEDAVKLVDSTVALSDEAFTSHIELMASTIASLTPAPVAPVVKPAQTVEDDDAEGNADIAALESAAASVKPAAPAITSETDEGQTVRASIEEYLSKTK